MTPKWGFCQRVRASSSCSFFLGCPWWTALCAGWGGVTWPVAGRGQGVGRERWDQLTDAGPGWSSPHLWNSQLAGKSSKRGWKGKVCCEGEGGGLWRWLQVSVWRIGCPSVCGCLVGLGQGRAGPGIVGCTWLTVGAGKGRAVLSWQQCLYLEFWVLGLGEGGRGGSRKGSQFDFWLPSFWQRLFDNWQMDSSANGM